jgi:hypothetical protein
MQLSKDIDDANRARETYKYQLDLAIQTNKHSLDKQSYSKKQLCGQILKILSLRNVDQRIIMEVKMLITKENVDTLTGTQDDGQQVVPSKAESPHVEPAVHTEEKVDSVDAVKSIDPTEVVKDNLITLTVDTIKGTCADEVAGIRNCSSKSTAPLSSGNKPEDTSDEAVVDGPISIKADGAAVEGSKNDTNVDFNALVSSEGVISESVLLKAAEGVEEIDIDTIAVTVTAAAPTAADAAAAAVAAADVGIVKNPTNPTIHNSIDMTALEGAAFVDTDLLDESDDDDDDVLGEMAGHTVPMQAQAHMQYMRTSKTPPTGPGKGNSKIVPNTSTVKLSSSKIAGAGGRRSTSSARKLSRNGDVLDRG